MLTYERALKRILRVTPRPAASPVALEDALGGVLVRSIVSRVDLPPFDNSAVDGYAVRCGSLRNGAVALVVRLIGRSEAGRPFAGVVKNSEAVRIFTGAPIPRGADAVVMQEHVRARGRALVIEKPPHRGQHIRRQGEDLKAGTQVLKAGTVLRPQELGLLAALGARSVRVVRRPIVAILATGDELRPAGSRLRPGHIYESNSVLLAACVQQLGLRAVRLGVVRDRMRPLLSKIRNGLGADVLLISGGVSVGEKDLVRSALKTCGVKTILWRVSIKPGMPLFCGKRGRTMVFGLPGNPVSVYATFEEFVKPALLQLMGQTWQDGYTTPAVLAKDLAVSSTRRTHFIRVRCAGENGTMRVVPLAGQGSHQLRSLVDADGWIRMNSEQSPWSVGTRVLVKQTQCPPSLSQGHGRVAAVMRQQEVEG